jgi:branched-chain amino acid transport system substrate-binding protein
MKEKNPAMKKFSAFLSLSLAAALVGGCASQPGGASKSAPSVIKIGCAAPLTGDQAQIGIDHCQGVQMAVEEFNASGRLAGTRVEILKMDDQRNPAQAVNAAKKLVSDPAVLGVIGHFNSSCTQPASAIYHGAGMTQITAASTNPDLSKQGFKTFFRVAATDDVQGPKGARFAAKQLGVKQLFVIDDKTTYGKGLADAFEKEAAALGIRILGHEGITQGDKDFNPLLTKIKPLQPDLIYFGGIYPEGSLLLRQARALGISAPFMGGDGIATHTLVELAGAAASEGTYATMVGGDMKKVPSATAFVEAYEKRYGKLGQWSAYGYDAANILLKAVETAPAKDRAGVLAAMRSVPSFTGITGSVVFDEKGDNRNQFIGIFKVTGGELVYVGPAE